METHHLKIEKTAKICTLGNPSTADQVWIVLHGYGQLAQYFIRHFNILESKGIAVIAPEAMSRFYVEGFSGRVGATWMTKEERETDIDDYTHYLDHVYQHFQLQGKQVTLLGFSQGGATASRWFSGAPQQFSKLILWSSIFPPDFDFASVLTRLDDQKCVLVFGIEDPFRSEEHVTQVKNIMNAFPNIDITSFDGAHEIHQETLLKMLN